MLFTFHGREDLEDGKIHTLWNPIFCYDADKRDGPDCDGSVRRQSSTTELLRDNLEEEEDVAYSRAHAAMEAGFAGLQMLLNWRNCRRISYFSQNQ